MRTQIHFDTSETKKWKHKTFSQLHGEMELLGRRVAVAANSPFTMTDFFIDSSFNTPALQVLFLRDSLAFWNSLTRTRVYLASPNLEPSFVTNEVIQLVQDSIKNVASGLVQCTVCGQWGEMDGYKRYDFAGLACEVCYNPRTCKQPNTRGD